MGGLQATQQFVRLFMFPGVYYCTGGHGPDTFDLFSPLHDWVEKGIAPQKVIAGKKNGDDVVRTRPVLPYPMQTKWCRW